MYGNIISHAYPYTYILNDGHPMNMRKTICESSLHPKESNDQHRKSK